MARQCWNRRNCRHHVRPAQAGSRGVPRHGRIQPSPRFVRGRRDAGARRQRLRRGGGHRVRPERGRADDGGPVRSRLRQHPSRRDRRVHRHRQLLHRPERRRGRPVRTRVRPLARLPGDGGPQQQARPSRCRGARQPQGVVRDLGPVRPAGAGYARSAGRSLRAAGIPRQPVPRRLHTGQPRRYRPFRRHRGRVPAGGSAALTRRPRRHGGACRQPGADRRAGCGRALRWSPRRGGRRRDGGRWRTHHAA